MTDFNVYQLGHMYLCPFLYILKLYLFVGTFCLTHIYHLYASIWNFLDAPSIITPVSAFGGSFLSLDLSCPLLYKICMILFISQLSLKTF